MVLWSFLTSFTIELVELLWWLDGVVKALDLACEAW
jgi:hypothetical protein